MTKDTTPPSHRPFAMDRYLLVLFAFEDRAVVSLSPRTGLM